MEHGIKFQIPCSHTPFQVFNPKDYQSPALYFDGEMLLVLSHNEKLKNPHVIYEFRVADGKLVSTNNYCLKFQSPLLSNSNILFNEGMGNSFFLPKSNSKELIIRYLNGRDLKEYILDIRRNIENPRKISLIQKDDIIRYRQMPKICTEVNYIGGSTLRYE